MPPVVVSIARYAQETDAAYNARVYRWRTWLFNEPRPDLWFTSGDEVQNYQRWRDQETAAA